MRDKLFPKLYYKTIHIHPLCDFFFRCQRNEGKTEWRIIYKDFWEGGGFGISRKEVKIRLKEAMEYFYK